MFATRSLMTLALLSAAASPAQNVTVTDADTIAVRDAKIRFSRGNPSPAAMASGRIARFTQPVRNAQTTPSNAERRFPADLSNSGGAVVTFAQSHAIYLNPIAPGFPNGTCTIANCWGDPEGFLRDLGVSEFIHLTDQYVKLTSRNRYTVGVSTNLPYTQSGPLSNNDILTRVHAVAASAGQSGYGHIYHVFLPPGQDVCQSPGVCYSPDIPSTDFLCGYHGNADFFDIGHVLYTVEPYQLGGCSVAPGSPNGTLADSTANTLSHEMFETITDPDFTAWFNSTTIDLQGEEIGDVCSFFIPGFFDVPVFKIGNKNYAVQREYDNISHSCSTKQ